MEERENNQAFTARQHIIVPDPAELLKTKVTLAVNRVMANYLGNLEQLADEHEEAMAKLIDALPEDEKAKVYLADIFGETRFEANRRAVLKTGNDARREIFEMIDFLNGKRE